jgi:small subunit ribosomal protein S19
MKPPFIDFHVYNAIIKARKTLEDGTVTVESHRKATLTGCRDTTIVPEFVGYSVGIHNGKKFIHVRITEPMVGYKLGAFSHTKHLGSSIHNSEHNAKKKAKLRRKLTERKIRKSAIKPQKKSKKAKASGPQKVKKGGKKK